MMHGNIVGYREAGLLKTTGYIIQLCTSDGEGAVLQFIVPYKTWEQNDDPQALNGEY